MVILYHQVVFLWLCISFLGTNGGISAPQEVRQDLMRNFMGRPDDISRLAKAHTLYSDDSFVTNLLGNGHFVQGNYLESTRYFRLAWEQTAYLEMGYAQNYVWCSKLAGNNMTQFAISTLAAVLRDRRADRELYELLRSTVVEAVHTAKVPLVWFVQHVLLEIPDRYDMWMVLTRHLLPIYISEYPIQGQQWQVLVPEDGNSEAESQISVLDATVEKAVAVLGLSMFPASPELLQLRALQYYASDGEDRLRCAGVYAAAALASEGLWSSSAALKEEARAAMQAIVVEAAVMGGLDKSSQDPTPSACLPALGRHSLRSYQRVHATISSLYGGSDRWARIGGLHGHPNPIAVESAVLTAYTHPPAADQSRDSLRLPSLQVGCADTSRCPLPGFLIADAQPSASTHFVAQAYNLSTVEGASVGLVYSSHTLEHLSHTLPPRSCPSYPAPAADHDRHRPGCASEQLQTLREWRRVLPVGGLLLLSAPDLEALARYFTAPNTTAAEKSVITAILFGGQRDVHDFHKTGLFMALLRELLRAAGFCQIERVPELGLFDDTSSKVLSPGRLISLNVRAVAC